MAPRRVIADSDDEDGDDSPLSPLKEDEKADRPEVEPLSPYHRPSSPGVLEANNNISDITDQSFFASVYDEQQSRALHQSHLIENIVRQSQQASRSSGEVSILELGKGNKIDVSSVTNVTSPVVLKKPRNHPSLLSDGASGVTTRQKSVPGEWDVPSSAEDAMVSRVSKISKGKNEKSYGKRRRSQSKAIRGSAAADIFMGYDGGASGESVRDTTRHNEMLAPSHRTEQSPLPASKRKGISNHDFVVRETAPVANFYIAQSNLTTMQKLEYEKVNVSQNGYSNLPGPLTNVKSSGMSTVAYPTPSRYASSSGPPLPWERGSAADVEPDESVDFVNIMSSPDVITAGHDHTEREPTEVALMDTQITYDEAEPPLEDTTLRSVSNKKKKRTRSIRNENEDEDELQDEPFDYETTRHQDKIKRRRNEPKLDPPDPQGDDDIELLPNPQVEIPREQNYQDLPGEEAQEANDAVPEIPATAPPVSSNAPEDNLPETQPAPQPKKRGRKKKQVISEKVIQEELPVETHADAQEDAPTGKDPEVQIEPEKPKKKRGRPRKSDLAKSETVPTSESELNPTHKAHEDDAQHNETDSKNEATEKPKPKKKQKAKNRVEEEEEEEEEEMKDPTPDKDDAEDTVKEISGNSKSSEEPASAEDVPAKPIPKPLADQRKSEEKASPASKVATTSSQPKVPYRVGLSKRTRIQSLLKIIKR
ncbi:uncharacterized protein F4812DRAFT_413129 [Daldinia caldariorum]|uniref:uncharacterized protein n=1 Tax=Daldinia caldariorum TaxID=326644 RepID=UPI002007CF02|nr:uncharacterized protein F4812DRAFT_413129 [Daldinia caldariorum]KAI1471195.1 hypothetical protein F4812DRAFT_413129 [Daldinia caldariorum]